MLNHTHLLFTIPAAIICTAEGDFGFALLGNRLVVTLVLCLAGGYFLLVFGNTAKAGGSSMHPLFNFTCLYGMVVLGLVWWLPPVLPWLRGLGIAALGLYVVATGLMHYQLQTNRRPPLHFPVIFEATVLFACHLLWWLGGMLLCGNWWLLAALPVALGMWYWQIRPAKQTNNPAHYNTSL